jgi:hypothetical protein
MLQNVMGLSPETEVTILQARVVPSSLHHEMGSQNIGLQAEHLKYRERS